MKTVGIIPARWGSTRFPGKPLHLIAGKPLIQHVWERCQEARTLDQIIVATDDMRIAQAAFDFGAEVALTSADCATGTDRVAEVAVRLPRKSVAVINIQGDEPLISPVLVDSLADTLRKDPKLKMVTAASVISDPAEARNPNCVKVALAKNGDAMYFSRSVIPCLSADPGSEVVLYRHQGIYGYRSDFLRKFVRWPSTPCERAERLEQLRALEHGVRIRVVLTEHESLGVDTPEDVTRVEAQLQS